MENIGGDLVQRDEEIRGPLFAVESREGENTREREILRNVGDVMSLHRYTTKWREK